jgi:hypothetical protein
MGITKGKGSDRKSTLRLKLDNAAGARIWKRTISGWEVNSNLLDISAISDIEVDHTTFCTNEKVWIHFKHFLLMFHIDPDIFPLKINRTIEMSVETLTRGDKTTFGNLETPEARTLGSLPTPDDDIVAIEFV